MDMNVTYVGLDVDDTQYHGSALNKDTGDVITFQCRPTLARLLQQLAKLDRAFPDSALSLCYEASYIGTLRPTAGASIVRWVLLPYAPKRSTKTV